MSATYFFPLKINDRRFHVCHLTKTGKAIKPIYGFIINSDKPTLLSVDTDEPKLISSNGFSSDVSIDKYSYLITKDDSADYLENADNLPVYRVVLQSRSELARSKSDKPMPILVKDNDFNKLTLVIDRSTIEERFVLVIEYKSKKGDIYRSAMRFYVISENCDFQAAAIDFGSEASQIRIMNSDVNQPIVNIFKNIIEPHSQNTEYWQGEISTSNKPNPYFKSIFFIKTKNPAKVDFGEMPMAAGNNSFLQMLTARDATHINTDDMVMYPNSKLLELAPESLNLSSDNINFTEDTNSDIRGGVPSLANAKMRDNITRLILSNFLIATIHNIVAVPNKNYYLRLVVLVPNVYFQRKVASIIEGLYSDFDIIKKNRRYAHFKGIEVQVISESDASFLGITRSTWAERLSKKEKKYFLIIDAGKGTTDFSVIRQNADSTFNSIYRYGIPASGHAVTHSFYEALYAFFRKHNLDIDYLLEDKDATRSDLLRFLEMLEYFKINYNNLKKNGAIRDPESKDVQSLSALNDYLRLELIGKDNSGKQKHDPYQIPDIDKFIDAKNPESNIAQITALLKESLNNLISLTHIQFEQVVFTGRGFLFEPFRNSIKEMIRRNGWLANPDMKDAMIDDIKGDEAKTVSVNGAFSTSEKAKIDSNSGLIGSPYFDYPSNFFRRIFTSKMSHHVSLSDDFLYYGQTITADKVVVNISGRTYNNFPHDEKRIYFVGNGFLCQTENDSSMIIEETRAILSDLITKLVVKSLFPYKITGEHTIADSLQNSNEKNKESNTTGNNNNNNNSIERQSNGIETNKPDNGSDITISTWD